MSNPLEDKKRKEHWIHKLKTEIKFIQTNKNELAINEFCEDIIQELVDTNEKPEETQRRLNDVRRSIDASREVSYNTQIDVSNLHRDVLAMRKTVFYGGIIIGALTLITLVVALANG